MIVGEDLGLADVLAWVAAARRHLDERGIYDPSHDLVDYVAEELWTAAVEEGVIDVRN